MSIHTRRQDLLAWLRTNRAATSEEAAKAFGVSLRTLHRDLAALRFEGVPIEGAPGRGGGIRVDPLATIPSLALTSGEATGLYLSLHVAQAVGLPTASAKGVMKKVAAALPNERVEELDAFLKRIVVKKGGGSLNDDTLLSSLEEAFSTHQGLRFGYGKDKTVTIHVQGLAFAAGKVLVLGIDAKTEALATFNAAKITKARTLKSVDATRVAVTSFKKLLK